MSPAAEERVTCPACGAQGLVCPEMVWHVERCVRGVRLSSRGALRERWEERRREEVSRGRAR